MSKLRAQNIWLALLVIIAFLLLIPPDGWPRTAAYVALAVVYVAGNMRIERRQG